MDDKNRRLLSMIVVAVGIGALYYATTELMGSEGSTDETVETQEAEGVTDLSFRFKDYVVREFQTKPGLRAFIRERADTYVGSQALLSLLIGP